MTRNGHGVNFSDFSSAKEFIPLQAKDGMKNLIINNAQYKLEVV